MPDIKDDIAAYEGMRRDLELGYAGKWVLFHERRFVSAYDTFEAAAVEAVRQFGRGPYLIRQVGAPPVTLPTAALYHPVHA